MEPLPMLSAIGCLDRIGGVLRSAGKTSVPSYGKARGVIEELDVLKERLGASMMNAPTLARISRKE